MELPIPSWLVCAGCCLTLLTSFPARSFATPHSSDSFAPNDRTARGEFRSSNGNSGTYTETYSVSGTTTTDTIVYTLSGSTETSTETLAVTTNLDSTKTVVFSDLAFGATAPFTSTTTYTLGSAGGAYGTGTFTAADGTTGTLTAVVGKTLDTSVTSFDFTTSAGVLTREVRLEERVGFGDSVQTLDVGAAGALTTATVVRFGGMHHQHP